MPMFLVDYQQGERWFSLQLEAEDWEDAEDKLMALQGGAEVVGRLVMEGDCEGAASIGGGGRC